MNEISEEDYKLAKEAHVSNCTGGTVYEINFVCASIVMRDDTFIPQFLIFVLPVLLTTTLLSDYAVYVSIAMISTAFVILSTQKQIAADKEGDGSYKPYLTVYRAGTMILTCIAILAVDFQFFPRRFAKVETFGTSLMDVGVGSFVFSSGIVSSRAYLKSGSQSMMKDILRAVRTALPILALGFSRLFLTKSVNYQEHTSEYGLHWNFFFTLGFLPPFVTLIGFLRNYISFFKLASMIAIGYQTALCNGLQNWVLNHPRVDLVTANKEGICSFVGYLSIFLFGIHCGLLIFEQQNQPRPLSTRLFWFSLIMWSVFGIWSYFFPAFYVSRQMANLPYIYWVIAFNLTLLSLIVLVQERLNMGGRGPSMLDSININGLFTFLLANILTGLTNLSIRTLYVDDYLALCINVIYMLIVCFTPWVMWRYYNVRVKF